MKSTIKELDVSAAYDVILASTLPSFSHAVITEPFYADYLAVLYLYAFKLGFMVKRNDILLALWSNGTREKLHYYYYYYYYYYYTMTTVGTSTGYLGSYTTVSEGSLGDRTRPQTRGYIGTNTNRTALSRPWLVRMPV